MIYTKRNQLTVIELQEEQNTVLFAELFHVLKVRPSLVVYIEVRGKLYGIITLGRISRAYENHLKQVEINTNFQSIGPDRTMEAREIFRQEKITTEQNKSRTKFLQILPVVSPDGKLLGHYCAKEDALFSTEYKVPFLEKINIEPTLLKLRLSLVRPCETKKKVWHSFFKLRDALKDKGFLVKTIDFSQVFNHVNVADYMIFYDEVERNTAEVLLSCSQENRTNQALLLSFQQFLIFLMDDVSKIFGILQQQGIHVLSVNFQENGSGYLKKFKTEIDNERRKNNRNISTKIFPDMKKAFLLELYEQLSNQELPFAFSCHMLNGVIQPRDITTRFFHVKHGKRCTIGQPEKYNRCIYVFGACFVLGVYTDDEHTIPSLLQEEINHAGLECKVENYGIISGGSRTVSYLSRLLTAPLMTGDVVIFVYDDLNLQGIQNLNLTDTLEQNHVPVTWFADVPGHCNHKANQLFAKAIYEILSSILRQPIKNRCFIEKDSDPVRQLYLNKYFADFNTSSYNSIGSIVMNCNPFTFGHLYLIEEALKQVDFLVIFVVEEDMSLFSFEERFSMVCAGVADLKNIRVVPSGNFILSRMTFPEYFIKETDEELIENTENDIKLFAEKIAQRLGITHRFVGDELADPVTNIYNQAMKRILPMYGIQLIEVSRKKNGQEAISASRVRKCLAENDLYRLDALVPDSTKEILFWS